FVASCHCSSLLFLLFDLYRHHRDLHSFPTRRSSDLADSIICKSFKPSPNAIVSSIVWPVLKINFSIPLAFERSFGNISQETRCQDRKSTRLNSSHVKISYAVFCLKKKKKKNKINCCR